MLYNTYNKISLTPNIENLEQISKPPYITPTIQEYTCSMFTQGGLNGPLESSGGAFFS